MKHIIKICFFTTLFLFGFMLSIGCFAIASEKQKFYLLDFEAKGNFVSFIASDKNGDIITKRVRGDMSRIKIITGKPYVIGCEYCPQLSPLRWEFFITEDMIPQKTKQKGVK